MDTGNFILHIETEGLYQDITIDMNEWFDTSGYTEKLNIPLVKGINKKFIGTFKDELNGMTITEFCAPTAKTYSISHYDENGEIREMKKAKGTKKCVIENDLKFDDYKDSVLKNKIILRSQLRFRSNHHEVSTEEVNKVAITTTVVMTTREYKILMGLQLIHM